MIKENIMMRIWTIYLLRRYGLTFVFGTLSILCLVLVDVPSVLNNAFSAVRASGSAWAFFNTAFSQSILFIKLALILELVLGFLVMKNLLTPLFSQRFAPHLAR
jgi:hypothetical protein